MPHVAEVNGAVLIDAGAPPSKKLRALATQRLARMRGQRRRSGVNLERFIDEARAG